jgi:hypothetical protein
LTPFRVTSASRFSVKIVRVPLYSPKFADDDRRLYEVQPLAVQQHRDPVDDVCRDAVYAGLGQLPHKLGGPLGDVR